MSDEPLTGAWRCACGATWTGPREQEFVTAVEHDARCELVASLRTPAQRARAAAEAEILRRSESMAESLRTSTFRET